MLRDLKTCTGACFRALEASKHAQAHAFELPSVLRACFEATEFDNTRRNTTSKPLDEALRRHWRRNRFENTILSTRSLRKLSTKLFEATGRSTSKALDEAAGRRNWTKKLDEETGRRNWTNQLSSKPPSSGQLAVTESREFNLVYMYIVSASRGRIRASADQTDQPVKLDRLILSLIHI